MATIDGGPLADDLTGGSDDDILTGLAGDDVLAGAGGDDVLDGGEGFDTADLGVGATIGFDVFLSAASSAVSIDGLETDALVGIERVLGTAFDDTFSALNGFLGDGSPLAAFRGGGGNDSIFSDGAVFVRAEYDDAIAGVRVDLRDGTAASVDADAGVGQDVLTGVAGVTGSNFNDVLLGGDELAPGPLGFESFRPLFGRDQINGRSGVDQIDYRGTLGVSVDMIARTAVKVSNGGHGPDTFARIENIHGSDFNDIIQGDLEANVLEGGAGDDFLRGNAGADVIDGGAGFDTGTWFEQTQGYVFTLDGLENTAQRGDGLETDIVRRIETINGTNFGDVFNIASTFVGDEGDFLVIAPGAGNDVITNDGATVRVHYRFAADGVRIDLTAGQAESVAANDAANVGVDQLSGVLRARGGAFDDVLIGDANAGTAFQRLRGDEGADLIDGNGGLNVEVDYFGSTSGVDVNLTTGVAQDGLGSTDTVLNVQHVRASAFDDALTGDVQSNVFRPRGGDDAILAGGGFDVVDYSLDAVAAIVFALSDASTAIGADVGLDTLAGFEALRGGAGADVYTVDDAFRNEAANLDGLNARFNAFEGGIGDDVVTGNGVTRVQYGAATAGVTADLATGEITGDASVGTDTVAGVFAVVGSNFDDVLRGSDDAPNADRFAFEEFSGLAGDDLIDGRGGVDRVDYLIGNNGAAVDADLATGQVTDGFGDVDTLIAIEGIGGTDLADTLRGDAGDNNFEPRAGDDLVDGRGGVDLVFYDNQAAGVIVDLAAETADDGEGGTDTLISIENVDGSAFADQISGSSADNVLVGRSGDDALFGRDGDDLLDGGLGADLMDGGLGDDTFIVDDAGDVIVDAGGVDSVLSSVGFTLQFGLENLAFDVAAGDVNGDGNSLANVLEGSAGANVIRGGGGADELHGNDGADILLGQDGDDTSFGGAGDDHIRGHGGDDTLHGGDGVDVLNGEEDDDVLHGGAGVDKLIGRTGNDVLFGEDGNDRLFGNSGDDIIIGGLGDDVLSGSFEADTFIFAPGCDIDSIIDFTPGEDKIDFTAFGFASFEDMILRDINGRAVINMDGLDDVLRIEGVLKAELSPDDFILV